MSQIKKLNALLFDTRSIQRYIYSGNLLSTNIGASYIVDRIFYDDLAEILQKVFPMEDFSTNKNSAWDITKDNFLPWQKMQSACIAYVGGGNALILFDKSAAEKRVTVVSEFTRQLLVKYPGLKVGAAMGELTLNTETWQLDPKELDSLYVELKKNQNTIFPAVNVPYSGLTLSCEVNGEAANFYGIIKKDDGKRFFSQEVAAKFQAAGDANENLKDRFNEIFEIKHSKERMDDYKFPLKVDELGQKEKENYFAIVHVDGNNMGLKFRTCNTLLERRKLSREIRRKTEGAFADLLLRIIQLIDKKVINEHLNLKGKTLPIRPLIIGGDDVTFICPANMAVMFTKTLMELMSRETPENAPEHLTSELSRSLDCCAGIAILPTAYPFFRGYILAEQLCNEAKKSMRLEMKEKKEKGKGKDEICGSNWLDFAILHGEQAPTLEQIRANEYTGVRGNMHFGPYKVDNLDNRSSKDCRYNIENLLECTRQFKVNTDVMAKNKVKELRNVLQYGKDETARFLRQLKYQKQKLPNIPDWEDYTNEKNLLWSDERESKTPYVDAIELMDFYIPEVAKEWQNLM